MQITEIAAKLVEVQRSEIASQEIDRRLAQNNAWVEELRASIAGRVMDPDAGSREHARIDFLRTLDRLTCEYTGGLIQAAMQLATNLREIEVDEGNERTRALRANIAGMRRPLVVASKVDD